MFKTRIDPFVSKMSYLRIFSGTLKKESNVHIGDEQGGQDRSTARRSGGQYEPIDEATAGNIVAVVKMDDLHTGDTISDGPTPSRCPRWLSPGR